jgi:hypothetical protein
MNVDYITNEHYTSESSNALMVKLAYLLESLLIIRLCIDNAYAAIITKG